MKFKVSSKDVKEDEGILYILLIRLEDKDLVKIGISGRKKIEDRVLEITLSIFKSYRFFPFVYPKRFRKTANKTEKEALLHKYFEDYRYTTEHKWGGCTEVFDIELAIVVEAYEKLLKEGKLGAEKYESESQGCDDSGGRD